MKPSPTKKIAFLDRDGVINKKAEEHNYITRVEDFVFNEGIFEVLTSLKERGFEFIVLTNQRGMARGIFSEEELLGIHTFMKTTLTNHGINILDIFYCPHGEDECECRKPKDGMLRVACEKYSVDLDSSIFITDSQKEVIMGQKFGISNSYFIRSDHPEDYLQGHVR